MKRTVVLLVEALLGLLLLLQSSAKAEPTFDPLAPVWQSTPPGSMISGSAPDGVLRPTIRYSGDSSQLMIVYTRRMSSAQNNTDPYYVTSSNNGVTWSLPEAIFTSPDIESREVTLTYLNNTAHVLWVERGIAQDTLYTASRSGSSFGSPVVVAISIPGNSMFTPKLIANGPTLHAVWAQNLPPSIFYSRSVNNGANWTPAQQVSSGQYDSLLPEIVVDSSEAIHVVWEQDAPTFTEDPANDTEIFYAQGIPAGTTTSWSTPIALSNVVNTPDAREPSLTLRGNQLQVAFSNFVSDDPPEYQQIYYMLCASTCTDVSRWNGPNLLTPQYLSVNTNDPFNVIPEIIYHPGTRNTYLYFHGGPPEGGNEQILGYNRCNLWQEMDDVTSLSARSANPSLTVGSIGDTDWVQLAYEQYNGSIGSIYTMKATVSYCPDYGYLPIVSRP